MKIFQLAPRAPARRRIGAVPYKVLLAAAWGLLMGVSFACQVSLPAFLPTPTASPTASPTITASPTPSPTATASPTSSPTATATPSPSPTVTPTPTATPSPTPTSTPTPAVYANGITVAYLDGGAAHFSDTKGGFELTLPPNWTIYASEDEIAAIFDTAAAANPDLAELLETFTALGTGDVRLFALDPDPAHTAGDTTPFLFAFLDSTTALVPLSFLVDLTARSAPQMFPGLEVEAWRVAENAMGLTLGDLTAKAPVTDANNTHLTAHERLVMFKSQGYTVALVMTSLEPAHTLLAPVYQAVVDSLALLQP